MMSLILADIGTIALTVLFIVDLFAVLIGVCVYLGTVVQRAARRKRDQQERPPPPS